MLLACILLTQLTIDGFHRKALNAEEQRAHDAKDEGRELHGELDIMEQLMPFFIRAKVAERQDTVSVCLPGAVDIYQPLACRRGSIRMWTDSLAMAQFFPCSPQYVVLVRSPWPADIEPCGHAATPFLGHLLHEKLAPCMMPCDQLRLRILHQSNACSCLTSPAAVICCSKFM